LHFRDVRLVSESENLMLTVDDDALDEHDITLYFVEHYDVHGTPTVRQDGTLTFHGVLQVRSPEPRLAPVSHAITTRRGRCLCRWWCGLGRPIHVEGIEQLIFDQFAPLVMHLLHEDGFVRRPTSRPGRQA
jgi:hypothetical protein